MAGQRSFLILERGWGACNQHTKDAKCRILDTGVIFLVGFVISKNRTAREHENESMGEYGMYHHSLSGVVKVPERNAILCLFFFLV